MRSEAAYGVFKPVLVAAVFLGFGLLTTGAGAQNAASRPPPTEQRPASTDEAVEQAAALERLAKQLAARRSDLDVRRHEIASGFDRLTATDRPAGEAELALLLNRVGTGERLERDMATLHALISGLTPEALRAFLMPQEAALGKPIMPDVGLSRTAIEVNLRMAPGLPPFAVVKVDTLVAQLAIDASGDWALVSAPTGIGFVPASQLRRDP